MDHETQSLVGEIYIRNHSINQSQAEDDDDDDDTVLNCLSHL